MNGLRVGSWKQRGRADQSFVYDDSWLTAPDARPLSLSLPLAPSNQAITGPVVSSFFDNLLPDNTEIRRRIQRRFACASDSPFDLLSEIGRDCVGALQLLPEDSAPPSIRRIDAESLDNSRIAKLLRSVTTEGFPGTGSEGDFRISIAGAQEKTALLFHDGRWRMPLGATPTTHIFKLPMGRIGAMRADMTQSIENEWLCLKLLAAVGMDTAKAEIAAFEDQRVLVVERFDRRLSSDGGWIMRIPQEDLCQATGTPPFRKYENEGGPGITDLMRLLLASRESANDRKKFLKAQILFWLLAAPDGHAKNFSIFVERQGRFSLTPLYDVMSAYPVLGHGKEKISPENLKMAMAVTGENRHYEWSKIQKRHWLTTAEKCGAALPAKDAIAEILERLPSAIREVSASLPDNFPDSIATPVFKGVLTAAERLA